jgi:hypothetical protein
MGVDKWTEVIFDANASETPNDNHPKISNETIIDEKEASKLVELHNAVDDHEPNESNKTNKIIISDNARCVNYNYKKTIHVMGMVLEIPINKEKINKHNSIKTQEH